MEERNKLFGLELPKGRDVQDWKDWPLSAKKVVLDSMKEWGLSRITSIEVMLHRVEMCGPYLYWQLGRRLPPITVINDNDDLSYPGYRKISAVNNFMGRKLTIRTNPPEDNPRKSKLTIIKPKKEHIGFFADNFNRYSMVSVEYTLDFKCGNPSEARNLFNLLKRYMYVPYCRPAGLKFYDNGGNQSINRTLRYGSSKLYERGPDKKMIGARQGWYFQDIDRVRWEFTAKRDQLKEKDVYSVSYFYQNPNFNDMLRFKGGRSRFRFVMFDEKRPDITKEWDIYYPTHEHQIGECLQEELFAQKLARLGHPSAKYLPTYLVTDNAVGR